MFQPKNLYHIYFGHIEEKYVNSKSWIIIFAIPVLDFGKGNYGVLQRKLEDSNLKKACIAQQGEPQNK